MRAKPIDSGSAIRFTDRSTSKKLVKFGRCASAAAIRALGLLKGDTMHWFWIGPHDEYERILRSR
jgi:hypothetical protein